MGIFTKGINKAAYSGTLSCPACHSRAVRKLEALGPYMERWRCRKCGLPFLYDIGPSAHISGNPDRREAHPYARLGDKFIRKYQVPIIGSGRKPKENKQ